VHLVHNLCAPAQPLHEPLRELEAQIDAAGANVKQQVARSRHGRVPRAGDLGERMQPGRARSPDQAIPQLRPEADDAAEAAVGDAKGDRADQPADVAEQVAHLLLGTLVDAEHQEDRGLGGRHQNGLRLWCVRH
jgi:hypothetical protein